MNNSFGGGKLSFFIKVLVYCLALFAYKNQAAPLKIAVASNFHQTLKQLLQHFDCPLNDPQELQSECEFLLSSGATGVLYSQIIQGAPFDLFFAADQQRPQQLEQRALTSHRQTYAYGKLVLWSTEPAVQQLSDLRHYPGRIAIAHERLAPFGRAALETLKAAQVYDLVAKQLLRGNNVNQVFQYVDTGNVAVALVAESQMRHAQQVFGDAKYLDYLPIPSKMHSAITQQMVILKKSRSASARLVLAALLEFINSKAVQQQLRLAGYEPALLPESQLKRADHEF